MSLTAANDHELPSAPPTAAPLIVIEGCIADQLIGEEVIHLAAGTLQLYAGSSTPPELVGSKPTSKSLSEGSEVDARTKGALTLRVGNAGFSLEPTLTTVFTHAENPRWYFFSLMLPPDPSTSAGSSDSVVHSPVGVVGSGSYVRLVLPEGIAVPGSALERSRDAFEDALISRGYLSGDPVLSAADEIRRSAANEARTAVLTLRERTQQHISSADVSSTPSSRQSSFAPTTRSFVEGRTNPVQRRRSSLTEWAAEQLANVSIAVGERVAGMFGIHVPTAEEQLEAGVTSPSMMHQSALGDQNRKEDRDTPAFITGSATPSDGGLAPTESDATPLSWAKPTDTAMSSNTDTHEVLKHIEPTANGPAESPQQVAINKPTEDKPGIQISGNAAASNP